VGGRREELDVQFIEKRKGEEGSASIMPLMAFKELEWREGLTDAVNSIMWGNGRSRGTVCGSGGLRGVRGAARSALGVLGRATSSGAAGPVGVGLAAYWRAVQVARRGRAVGVAVSRARGSGRLAPWARTARAWAAQWVPGVLRERRGGERRCRCVQGRRRLAGRSQGAAG
jgi:hypothetical protein